MSRNQLAKLTGISRRTLARLEKTKLENGKSKIGKSFSHEARSTVHEARRRPRLSARIAFKLAKALLGEEETERQIAESTRLSRFLGKDPLYKFLDVLYHYPAFLFHDSPQHRLLRQEFGDDYRHSLDLLLRSGFGTRNLGARLRAFRMRHDLTLVETAALVGLSKSELHRLERAERSPSPRTRYRILRLLTLPISPEEVLRTRSSNRQHWLAALKAALAAPPPPRASELQAEADPSSPSGQGELDKLRHLWLAGPLKTRELADALGVSPPHLIRLVRGDRKPSRRLREQLRALASRF